MYQHFSHNRFTTFGELTETDKGNESTFWQRSGRHPDPNSHPGSFLVEVSRLGAGLGSLSTVYLVLFLSLFLLVSYLVATKLDVRQFFFDRTLSYRIVCCTFWCSYTSCFILRYMHTLLVTPNCLKIRADNTTSIGSMESDETYSPNFSTLHELGSSSEQVRDAYRACKLNQHCVTVIQVTYFNRLSKFVTSTRTK